MSYCFISGGTGTPKLMQGFSKIIDEEEISVICNNGDDYLWNRLRICPDLDTLLYLFAELLDTEKFWGVKNDTFNALASLISLNADDTWFNVGDKDLALHVFRNHLFSRMSLTNAVKVICEKWSIKAKIMPMCDQLLQTRILTNEGELHFQEYFVKYRYNVEVVDVKFVGDKTKTTPEVLDTIKTSKAIIIGPSNPITSIGPILSINPIREELSRSNNKKIAISPVISNKAFSGPTINLMKAKKIELSPIGVARQYSEFLDILIMDPQDKIYKSHIEDLGIEPVFMNIDLSSMNNKINLSESILNLI